jgi:hypothetical protein
MDTARLLLDWPELAAMLDAAIVAVQPVPAPLTDAECQACCDALSTWALGQTTHLLYATLSIQSSADLVWMQAARMGWVI